MKLPFKAAAWSQLIVPSGVLFLILAGWAPYPAHSEQRAVQTPTPQQVEFFEKSIRPVLADRCYGCHSADGASSGGLRLDSRASILAGGKSGPAVLPGNPDESLLLQKILLTDPEQRMPKGEDHPLPATVVENLRTWILQGAYWPEESRKENKTNSLPGPGATAEPGAEKIAYFTKNVQPIFVNRCYNCHSAAFKPAGGLRLDDRDGAFSGGKSGPVFVPGNPAESLLLKKILLQDPKHRMPKESPPLSATEIATLSKWIQDGAVWPEEIEKLPPTPSAVLEKYADLRSHHWAFQPIANPAVPAVADKAWPDSDLDRFVLAKLQENKMSPVDDADPVTLIRRVTYDLTGLPPTPAAVAAFRRDHSPEAYSRLVDGLLASPRFGERWGRHWLDIARYGESTGPSRNIPYPDAWRYRNYVIDAVNRDIPFNRFLEEQIAGDLLPAASPEERDRLNTATGFLALGPKDVNQRFKARYLMDNVDDQIDTVSRAALAMTVSCARCHNHKFDPIPTTDYYALAGIFTSSQDAVGLRSLMGGGSLDYYDPKRLVYRSSASEAPAVSATEVEELKAKAAAAKLLFTAVDDTPAGRALEPDGRQVQAVRKKAYQHLNEQAVLFADLGARGYGIQAEREGTVSDTWVRIRGIEERRGPRVPRGFLTAFQVPNTPAIGIQQSGRLQLAEWLTNPGNPLTSRVYVNRVWQHLFGSGLVTTVDNFGTTGDRPSNPLLLDALAQQFMRDGWSTKKLIRALVLSHTYRLGSDAPSAYLKKDPANRLVWGHSPRRLEAEEVRDSILASAGTLQLGAPATAEVTKLPMIEIADDGPAAYALRQAAEQSTSRSIYLPLLRDITPPALAAFDPVTQTLVTGGRDATIVPSQALFMLNSFFVRRQALFLAQQLLTERNRSTEQRLDDAYQLILGRRPTRPEEGRDFKFLAQYESSYRSLPPQPRVTAEEIARAKAPPAVYVTCDNNEHVAGPLIEAPVQPENAKEAAWLGLVQSLFASAEFQFVR